MFRRWRFGIAVAVLSSLAFMAVAQGNYPAAPIRIVLGYGAGGVTDQIARLISQKIAAQMNATVVVENKPGAAGNIANAFVAKAKPDGHTVLLNNNGVVVNPAFSAELDYDPFRQLAPVALVASTPFVVIASPQLPVNTMTELINHLKANPDRLAYGSTGNGSTTHMGALLLLQAKGLSATHVTYKETSVAMNDLMSDRIQFRYADVLIALPLIKDKRIKVLAITSPRRSPIVPDVPSITEALGPGFEVGSWFGVMVPANTSAAIVKTLNAEVVKALQDANLKTALLRQGVETIGSTPEEYGAYLRSEYDRWTRIIKSNNIKAD